MLQDLHISRVILYQFTCLCSLFLYSWKLPITKVFFKRNFLVFYDQLQIISNLNMSHWNMSNFVLLWLFEFTLFIKLRNFDFESHWNTLIFLNTLNKKYMLSDLNMTHGKMSDFDSFLLFGFNLVIKLWNFSFEGR